MQHSQKNGEIKEQPLARLVETSKSMDDTLFELVSSAKYIVINKGVTASDSSGKKIYNSPDGEMIEKDPQNLSIYYDGKTIEFDRDFNVVKNDLSEREIRKLNQKIQETNQKSLKQNRNKEIQQNIDLSL